MNEPVYLDIKNKENSNLWVLIWLVETKNAKTFVILQKTLKQNLILQTMNQIGHWLIKKKTKEKSNWINGRLVRWKNHERIEYLNKNI